MPWIILTVLAVIAVVATWYFTRVETTVVIDREFDVDTRQLVPTTATTHPYRSAGIVAMICIGVIWLLLTGFFMIKPVKAGEVGIVRQFGGIVGQTSEGVAIIAPWQSMDTVSIRTERHTFGSTEAPITAASAETQDVFIVATINYSVSSSNVQDLIRDVGTNWFDVLVPTRVNQYIKQETAKWATIDIIPNREQIRQAVLIRLRNDLGENYSITVSDFLIDNISFSPEYTQAIEDKQVATEQAEAADNRTAVVAAEADQTRTRAQGEADAVEIAAQGQANANALLSASLTPELLQWQAIQQLGPNVDIALIPSGEGLILDPSTLLAPDEEDQ